MNITFDCLVSNAHEEINKLNQAKRNEMEAKFIYNFFSSLFWFLTICVNSFVMDNSKENHRLVLVRAFTHTEKKTSPTLDLLPTFLLSHQVKKQSKLNVLKMVTIKKCITIYTKINAKK